jgi:hypothetical protein
MQKQTIQYNPYSLPSIFHALLRALLIGMHNVSFEKRAGDELAQDPVDAWNQVVRETSEKAKSSNGKEVTSKSRLFSGSAPLFAYLCSHKEYDLKVDRANFVEGLIPYVVDLNESAEDLVKLIIGSPQEKELFVARIAASGAFVNKHMEATQALQEWEQQKTEEAPQPTEEAPQPTEEAPQKTEEAPQPTEEAPQPTEEAPQKTEEAQEEKPKGKSKKDDKK